MEVSGAGTGTGTGTGTYCRRVLRTMVVDGDESVRQLGVMAVQGDESSSLPLSLSRFDRVLRLAMQSPRMATLARCRDREAWLEAWILGRIRSRGLPMDWIHRSGSEPNESKVQPEGVARGAPVGGCIARWEALDDTWLALRPRTRDSDVETHD